MRIASSSPMSPNVAEHVRRRAHLGWIAVAAFLGVISSGAASQAQTASVVVTSDVNPSVYLQTVTFTATVSPAGATGTVTFKDSLSTTPVLLCINVPLVNGQAQCVRSNLPAGSHPIIARFNGGGGFAATTSAPDTQVVNRAPTNCVLTTNPNPTEFNQNVAMTVTITPSQANGQVKFFNDGNEIGTKNVVGGQATLNFNTLLPGFHTITAVYLGQTNYEPCTTNSVLQEVRKPPSTTTLTFSQNPTTCGQQVTFTATVDPSDATGDVNFTVGGGSVGTAPVIGGVATLDYTTIVAGPPPTTVGANYSGNDVYQGSSDADPLTVNKAPTTTNVTSDINPSFFLQGVTYTATVSTANATAVGATGSVTFRDSVTVIGGGPRPVNNGQASVTVSNLIGGRHSITATYNGDGCYLASPVSPAYFQSVNTSPTTSSVTANFNPSIYFQNIRITMTVVPIGAFGQVRFFSDGNQIGTAALNSLTGLATLQFRTLTPGLHVLTATYVGNANYSPATTGPYNQVIEHQPVTLVLTSNTSPSPLGEPLDLIATVKRTLPESGDPTGSVRFYDGAFPDTIDKYIGSGDLSRVGDPNVFPQDFFGVAITTVSSLTCGTHPLSAMYVGNQFFNPSWGNFNQDIGPCAALRQQADAMVTKLATESIESGVRVSWTGNRLAFKNLELQRAIAATGPWSTVNAVMRDDGGSMVAVDNTAGAGRTYFYRLLGTTASGTQSVFGPVEGSAGAPRAFALSGVWPNPTHGALSMAISVPKAAQVRVSVLDLQGREVALLANGGFPAGRHEIRWDGRTGGAQAPAGLYFIRLITPERKFVSRVAIAH